MSDERLRDLERRAQAGEADAALALAAALERLGRPDDAFDALLPARGDARVRRELCVRAEGWALGGAKPVLREPGLRWMRTLDPIDEIKVLGHALYVRSRNGLARLVDGETGELHPALPKRPSGFVRDVALHVARDRLLAFDGWTAEPLYEVPIHGVSHRNLTYGSYLVRCARGWVRVESFADPGRPPMSGWQHQIGSIVYPSALVSGERVVCWGATLARPGRRAPHEVRALTLDGGVVWTRDGDGAIGAHAAGDGAVVLELSQDLAFVDASGTTRWQHSGVYLRSAGRRVVVCEQRSGPTVLCLERESGRVQLELGNTPSSRSVAVARDVIVHASSYSELKAERVGGEPLWSFRFPGRRREGSVNNVWPAHGRLYVKLGDRTLACLT